MSAVTGQYRLKFPITLTLTAPGGGAEQETVTDLTVRRPKARDLRVVDAAVGEVAQSIALIARLTGRTIAEIDELDAEDFAAVGVIVESFTPPGLRTGGTSSGA